MARGALDSLKHRFKKNKLIIQGFAKEYIIYIFVNLLISMKIRKNENQNKIHASNFYNFSP